jgi:hypothetical protein
VPDVSSGWPGLVEVYSLVLPISANVVSGALEVKGSAVAVEDVVTRIEDFASLEVTAVVPDVSSGWSGLAEVYSLVLPISANVVSGALEVKGSAVSVEEVEDVVTRVEDLASLEVGAVVPDVPSG